MKARTARSAALVPAVCCIFLATSAAAESRLDLIDGTALKSPSVSVDERGVVQGEGLPNKFVLDDLRGIVFADSTIAAVKRPIAAVLAPEGRLPADDVTIGDEKCVFIRQGVPLTLRIDTVRAIRFDANMAHPPFDKAVAAPLPNADRIFFLGEDKKLDSVTGMVESLTADELKFSWDKQDRKLPRDQVWGIVFAGTSAAKSAALVAHLRDGSQIPGKLTELSPERATLSVGGGKLELPVADLLRLELRSNRIAFLSDLKPLAEEQAPLVTAPRPWQRDRAANGRPLTIKDRTFQKGLGTHAMTRLTFAADAKFDRLVGVLGIDASAAGKGDCNFVVQGDGNELFSRRIRGTDPPFDLQVEIRGIKQITILVDPGEDLDLADYANWCDLRFLKQPEKTARP